MRAPPPPAAPRTVVQHHQRGERHWHPLRLLPPPGDRLRRWVPHPARPPRVAEAREAGAVVPQGRPVPVAHAVQEHDDAAGVLQRGHQGHRLLAAGPDVERGGRHQRKADLSGPPRGDVQQGRPDPAVRGHTVRAGAVRIAVRTFVRRDDWAGRARPPQAAGQADHPDRRPHRRAGRRRPVAGACGDGGGRRRRAGRRRRPHWRPQRRAVHAEADALLDLLRGGRVGAHADFPEHPLRLQLRPHARRAADDHRGHVRRGPVRPRALLHAAAQGGRGGGPRRAPARHPRPLGAGRGLWRLGRRVAHPGARELHVRVHQPVQRAAGDHTASPHRAHRQPDILPAQAVAHQRHAGARALLLLLPPPLPTPLQTEHHLKTSKS